MSRKQKRWFRLNFYLALSATFIFTHPLPSENEWSSWIRYALDGIILLFLSDGVRTLFLYARLSGSREPLLLIFSLFIIVPGSIIGYLFYLGILSLLRSNYEPISLIIVSGIANTWILTTKDLSAPLLFPSSDYLASERNPIEYVMEKRVCRETLKGLLEKKTDRIFRGAEEETDFDHAITDALVKYLDDLYKKGNQQTAEKCASMILMAAAIETLLARSKEGGFSPKNSPSDKKLCRFARKYIRLCYKNHYINDTDYETGVAAVAMWRDEIKRSAEKAKKANWKARRKERNVVIILIVLAAVAIVAGGTAIAIRNRDREGWIIVPRGIGTPMTATLSTKLLWNDGVGDSWSAAFSINGEKPENVESDGEYLSCFWDCSMEAGDEVILDSLITEDDTLPDEGMERTSYKVRAKDLVSGFTIVQHIAVEENNGQYYSNKTATWIVLCMFFPSDRLGDIAIRFGT